MARFFSQATAAIVLAAVLVASGISPTQARTNASNPHHTRAPEGKGSAVGQGYYVAFLARPTQYFGHSYVQLGSTRELGGSSVAATAGFYPKTTKAVFGAPGYVGATRRDLRTTPSVRYRVAVSAQTYQKARGYVAGLAKTWRTYDLVGHNCNHMVGAIASRLGLAVPTDAADVPESFVRALQSLNAGRTRASWRPTR